MQSSIHALLEQVATTDIDFDKKCFERFFQISEEGKTLMAHMDRVHRGKMMVEIYRLMMARDLDDEADYLNWEAQNHETAYFVPGRLYPIFMRAFKETVAETLDYGWTKADEDAFARRCDQIVTEIQSRYSH